jgi:ribonuclease HI
MCQYDIIKYMLQRLILSGRLGKWAFALVEYDLEYERLTSKRGQVVVDFVVEHHIELANDVGSMDEDVWKLFFDGSVCSRGQGIGCFIVSPKGVEYELSIRLEFECTNNQAEYEALLSSLQALVDMEAKSAYLYGDSELVVQQMNGTSQCLDGSLNEHWCKCLDILEKLGDVNIKHIRHEHNEKSNTLAQ